MGLGGGRGCVSGVHSNGRGTVRCGRRQAGPARPVGWKLRAGISLRSGCGGWCRGGIEKGSVPRLLWEQGNGGSAGHVPVGQWLPRGRWGRSDRGRRMRGKTSHRVGALGGEGLSSGSAMPCRKSRKGGGGCQWAICGRRRSGRVCGGGVGFRQFFGSRARMMIQAAQARLKPRAQRAARRAEGRASTTAAYSSSRAAPLAGASPARRTGTPPYRATSNRLCSGTASSPAYRGPWVGVGTKRPLPRVMFSRPSCHTSRPRLMVVST